MEISYRLRQFELLDHFSDEQIDRLSGCTSRMHYPAQARILEEGAPSREAYLIDTGAVRIERNTPYGRYTLADLSVGDLFGEASLIDRSARSSDAVVQEDASLFPLQPARLESAAEEDPRFHIALYWAFWKSLSEKLRHTNDKLAHFFSARRTPPDEASQDPSRTGEFSVGLAAKRDLFREQKLSQMEISFLASLSKEKRLGPGAIVFREGEEGDRMYVVLDGRVMISKQIAGAGEEALGFAERGDYFGEMALIDRQPRSADARAGQEGAVVLAIPREVLVGILDIQKVSSLRLLQLLCRLVAKRLREIDDKLVGWFIFAAGAGESLDLSR